MVKTYRFNESGTIPGIPGIWSPGHIVTIDDETFSILNVENVIKVEEVKKPLSSKTKDQKIGE